MPKTEAPVILNDRYELLEELGRGGMGAVYRAHDSVLDRDVAVKLLSAGDLGTEGRERMLREAQAIAKLNHPNIVQVHDAGQLEPSDGSGQVVPYIVMELVEGNSLHDQPPEDLQEIVAVARQICTALEHAHQLGIIHRDLKPENVLIEPDGTAKLMDFGLARSMTSRLTTEGQISGTVFYLAPEVALGQPVDGRADLYSLGIMLYELTTGVLPFAEGDPLAVISQHLHASVVPPRAHSETIPPGLDALIVRLLSKRPEERPESAQEVSLALERLDAGEDLGPTTSELSLLERFVRGRLVGRQPELAEAWTCWQRAAHGHGQVLLVSGEPGVGKTRLVRELATRANVSGGRTLVGECYAEGGVPFAPVAQMIRTALDSGAIHSLPDPILADLVAISPDLRSRYPNLPANPPLDPQAERQRLFESVVALCLLWLGQSPLMLIFEDAHWADGSTLSLLRHLGRRLRQSRALIVASYREIELEETGPFTEVLHDLNHERLATRIKLSRLDRQGTHDLLSSMFAEEITPDFLDGIYRETEGNPFFIEEVCKALIDTGKLYFADGSWHRPRMEELEFPQSVRLAIQSRVRKLSESTQETLHLAAIFGREFEYPILAKASDLDEETLIDALERAERAQLIDSVGGRREVTFSFTHALIPTALYEEIGTLRRRRMHRSAAESIVALRPDDYESLAHHYNAGGERGKAIDYSRKAAGRSRSIHAYDNAKQYLTSALSLLDPGEGPEVRLELLEELADAHFQLGEFGEAVPLYQEALEIWGSQAKPAKLTAIRLHRKIVDTETSMTWFADRQRFEPVARASSQAGLELAEGEPPHQEVARLWIALSYYAWVDRVPPLWDEAERYARAGVAMAEHLDDPDVLSAALDTLAKVYGGRGLFRERQQVSLRRLALSRDPRFSDVQEKASILLEASHASRHVGEFAEAIAHAKDAEEITEKVRAVGLQVAALRDQAYSWFWLDGWDNVLEIDQEWRTLEPSYANFYERAGPMCFMIALSASVHALRGEAVQAARLRAESYAIMSDVAGPPERWDRSQHY